MAYSLNDAITSFKSTFLWQSQAMSYQPLDGVVDGVNRIFTTFGSPIADMIVYNPDLTVLSAGSYTADLATGTVILNTAPDLAISPLRASYSVVPYTDAQLLGIGVIAFMEMQNRYPRAWYLVESGGSEFVSSDPNTIVDPQAGPVLFSQSPIQTNVLQMAIRYTFAASEWGYAAGAYYSYSENRAGGLRIDRSKQADQLKGWVEFLSSSLDAAITLVAGQVGGFGTYIPSPHTLVYDRLYRWQQYGRPYTWRGLY